MKAIKVSIKVTWSLIWRKLGYVGERYLLIKERMKLVGEGNFGQRFLWIDQGQNSCSCKLFKLVAYMKGLLVSLYVEISEIWKIN